MKKSDGWTPEEVIRADERQRMFRDLGFHVDDPEILEKVRAYIFYRRENRAVLLGTLIALGADTDRERAHTRADQLLVAYIGDDEITQAYEALTRWCG